MYVLVTVEPEGIVAIPNFKERSFIIYNIGKAFSYYNYLINLSSFNNIKLVVRCEVFLIKLTLVVNSL